jgi:hypothetical protein
MAYARTRTSKSVYSSSGDLFWKETSDTPTPLFKARVASGELICKDYESGIFQVAGPVSSAVTGFHVTKITGGVPPTLDLGNTTTASTRQMINSSSKWIYGSPAAKVAAIYQKCGSAAPPGPDDETWAEAHTKLSADLNTGISSILVSAAELPKTVKMINKALVLLRNPLINAKNKLRLTRAQLRTPQGRKAALDMAEQDWLEGRYGWRPFVYDVMSWVESGKSKYSDRRTVKTAVQKLAPPPYTFVRSSSTGGLIVAGTSVWTAEYVASSGQTADFGVNLSQFARTWGALDVVGTGWELIKFSFVLDWFLNLGDTLKALQVYALIDERIGWNKITSIGTIKTTFTYPTPGLHGDLLVDGYINRHSMPTIERGQMTKRMRVDSFLPNLGWSFNVDCGKTLDLLAIIHQLYKGGSRRP